jgi:hypothetical protein
MKMILHLAPPPPFAWVLIDQNTRLVTCAALPRVLTAVLCGDFHQKCELGIWNGGQAASFFFRVFFILFPGPIGKKELGTRHEYYMGACPGGISPLWRFPF